MYHCSVNFCLVGLSEEAAHIVESTAPLPPVLP